MQHSFRNLTLGLATTILVAVSLACSYWFFASIMPGGGISSILAGIAGCAVQIFAYGFSAHIANDSDSRKFWVFVCVMPLLLSIFSTYTTLYGFINAAVEKDTRLNESAQAKRKVIEELIRDNRVARNAISQTNVDSIRKNTDTLERAIDVSSRSAQQDLQLLDKLDDQSTKVEEVTPLSGLIRVTGNSTYATNLLCIWLALLFDLLPVLAISILFKETKGINSVPSPIEADGNNGWADFVDHSITIQPHVDVEPETDQASVSTMPSSPKVIVDVVDENPIVESAIVTQSQVVLTTCGNDEVPRFDDFSQNDSGAVETNKYNDEAVLVPWPRDYLESQILSGNLELSYEKLISVTGWSRYNLQQLMDKLKGDGKVVKVGRRLCIPDAA